MATACESDSEMQGARIDAGRDVLREPADDPRLASETKRAPSIDCFGGIRSRGEWPSPERRQCCMGCGPTRGARPDVETLSVGMQKPPQSHCHLQHSDDPSHAANGLVHDPSLTSSTASINFGASSAPREVPSIADRYRAYVQAVRDLVVERDVATGELRACLRRFDCAKKRGSGPHPLFSRSSSVLKAETQNELFAAVQQVTSWYNHTLVAHVAVSLLGEEGEAMADRYSTALTGHCATMLLLLPQPGSSASCPEDFEEIFADVERSTQSCSLADAVRVHAVLADIFNVRRGALFLAGIGEGKGFGSIFTFWLPRSVSSWAVNAALANAGAMGREEIARIRTKYETISVAPAKDHTSSNHGHRHSIGVAESGYETQYLSSSTLNVIGTTSRCHDSPMDSSVEEEGEDEVFIREVSPDAVSDALDCRPGPQRYVFGRYSVGSSPVEWSADTDSDRSHTAYESDLAVLRAAACSDDGEEESTALGESPNVADAGRNGERDRIGFAPSPQVSDDNDEEDEEEEEELAEMNEHIHINPLVSGMNAGMQDSVSLMCSAGMCVQQRRKDSPRQRALSASQESIYIAMSSAPATLPEATPPGNGTEPCHRPSWKPLQRFSYCIVRCAPSSFVKRVLHRASEKWPANLQMVAITSYNGCASEGAVSVARAQRVTALYAKGRSIVVATAGGEVGGLPYASCRLSKSYYGMTSKMASLDATQFYTISTMCIHKVSSFTAEQVYPGEPVDIDFIAIRSHSAGDKDELDVSVGDYIRMLYCDDNWVYGCSRGRRAGFVPRDNCRLVTKSEELLRHCHWITQSFRFQADFVFDLTKPPPSHLLHNFYLPNEDLGKTMMLAHSYTPPGSSCTIQRGVPLKIIYTENRLFFYVAMSNGMSFWIPALYCQSFSLKRRRLSSAVTRSNEDLFARGAAMFSCISPTRSSSIREGSPKRKKKVSFAPSVGESDLIHCSNPELSSAMTSSRARPSFLDLMIPARRARSSDSFQVFTLMNEESPSLCSTGCNFFCF